MELETASNLLPPRDRAMRVLRSLLAEGAFGKGETMPSERVLAQRVGVSRDTIRAVLHDLARQGLVSSSRARVRRVIASGALGATTPGIVAKTIALISDNPISQDSFRTVPTGFESRVFTSCAIAIQEAGLHVLAVHAERLSEQDLAGMASQGLGGMILFGHALDGPLGQRLLRAATSATLPLVVQGNSPELAGFDRCYSDHEAGAYELTRFLIARGKRRILPFWRFANDHHWLRCRLEGYQRAMIEARLQPLEPVRTPNLPFLPDHKADFHQAVRLIAGYLVEPSTGDYPIDSIMVATDPHAYEVAAALKLVGRDPTRFPIVGYDNDYLATPSREWAPMGPIATAEKDNTEVGRQMAWLLTERIRGSLPKGPQQRRIVPRVIEITDP